MQQSLLLEIPRVLVPFVRLSLRTIIASPVRIQMHTPTYTSEFLSHIRHSIKSSTTHATHSYLEHYTHLLGMHLKRYGLINIFLGILSPQVCPVTLTIYTHISAALAIY